MGMFERLSIYKAAMRFYKSEEPLTLEVVKKYKDWQYFIWIYLTLKGCNISTKSKRAIMGEDVYDLLPLCSTQEQNFLISKMTDFYGSTPIVIGSVDGLNNYLAYSTERFPKVLKVSYCNSKFFEYNLDETNLYKSWQTIGMNLEVNALQHLCENSIVYLDAEDLKLLSNKTKKHIVGRVAKVHNIWKCRNDITKFSSVEGYFSADNTNLIKDSFEG